MREPGHVVGRHLALEVHPHQHRLPGHVDEGVENVLPHPAPLHQLEAGYPEPLVADLGSAG